VQVRLQPPLLAALDQFIAGQEDAPTRPEAARVLLAATLQDLDILQTSDI
jgi:hypothetical protein